jgi:hypothetical protein
LKVSSAKTIIALVLAWTGLGTGTLPMAAQQVQHLTVIQPGGMPGLPIVTGISQVTNGFQLSWSGPSGYYQVLQKSNSLTARWLGLGKATNLAFTATVTRIYSNAFFTVSGPSPKYLGAQGCTECHGNIHGTYLKTAHAGAFADADFAAAGGQNNPSCLACHTVGYKLPTGFVSKTATPQLANVQCENCHGPAANHAANPNDPTVVPRVDIAAQVCGGCHNASQSAYTNPPTFEEWSASGHAAVVPDALQSMSGNTNNIRSCGVCHSGSARLALLAGQNPAVTMRKDYDVPQTCVVCHDPHQTNAYPVQLRNPLSSTNYFALTSANTATAAAFTSQYKTNVNINLCAQCHNDRGAAWTDTKFAPHHSLQYNFLLGSVGELQNGPAKFNPGTHAGLPASAMNSLSGTFYLTNQCAACHMQSDSRGGADHSTMITSDTVCMNCHVTPPEILEEYYLTPAISNSVTTLLTALNTWASRQTNALLTATNVVAWEYSNPGGLTWQTNSAGVITSWSLSNPVTFTGPNTDGQSLLTTNFPNILKVRYNLYTVLNDGSFGVHNPTLAISLLDTAKLWMTQLLQ